MTIGKNDRPLMYMFILVLIFAITTCVLFSSCEEVKTGKFVSTEKPIIVLGKTYNTHKYGTTRYFHVYLDKFIKVEVNENMWNSKNVGDTIKNVAIVIK